MDGLPTKIQDCTLLPSKIQDQTKIETLKALEATTVSRRFFWGRAACVVAAIFATSSARYWIVPPKRSAVWSLFRPHGDGRQAVCLLCPANCDQNTKRRQFGIGTFTVAKFGI